MSASDAPSNPLSRKRSMRRARISGLVRSGAGTADSTLSLPRRGIERRGIEQPPIQQGGQPECRPFLYGKVPIAAGAAGRLLRILDVEKEPRRSRQRNDQPLFEIENRQACACVGSEVPERHEHAVARVIGYPQRAGVDDADETRRAAAVRRVHATLRIQAADEDGVCTLDEGPALVVQLAAGVAPRDGGGRGLARLAPLDVSRAVADALPDEDVDLLVRDALDRA